MKKIMLAAVAASFMSTGASAVQLPAEGEVCSDIHSNITSGINVVELSDYRKCVMIQHEIDTAFTYKTFWVRNGDMFTSFPVETLAKMNRSERVEFIETSIHKTIVEDVLAKQAKAYDDLILELQMGFATIRADLIADHAEELRKAIEAKDKVIAMRDAVIEAKDIEISVVTQERHQFHVERDEALEDVKRLEAEIKQLKDDADQYIADFSAAYESLGYAPVTTLAQAISTAARYGFDSRNAEVNGLIKQLSDANSEISTLEAELDELESGAALVDQAAAMIANAINKNETIDVSVSSSHTTPNSYDVKVVVNGLITNEVIANISRGYTFDVIEDAFEEGYARGFNDGYDKGFADGYDAGFSDGVRSVSQ